MRDFEGERGQVLPFVAICLTVLMGFAAFAVDVGYLRYQERLQQTAADAAALAGAHELIFTPNNAAVQGAAQADALKDGFAASNVQVHWTPRSGPFTGDLSAVEVIVSVPQPSFFSGIITGTSTTTVTARAVARAQPTDSGACVWIMQSQLNINSVHANLQLPTCGVMDNGDIKGQNGTVVATYLAATGTISNGKNFSSTTQILPGIPPFTDPCPTIPGCAAMVAAFTADPNGGDGAAVAPPTYNGTSLSPGHYTSWPSVSGTLCLQAGLYVVDSAGTTADLVGPGLKPVNAGPTAAACPGSSTDGSGVTIATANMDLNVGSNSNLVAPAGITGISLTCNASTYSCVSESTGVPGVLFYDSCTCNMPWNNSANTLLGMMYFPNGKVELNGTNAILSSTYIVAGQVIGNQIDLNVPSLGGNGKMQILPVLVE